MHLSHREASSPSQKYEAPTLRVVGPVHAVTQTQDKKIGPTDGFTFQGVSITNASP